jgi:lysophospholipase L1-like esterase
VTLASVGNKQYAIAPSVGFYAQTANRADVVAPGISGDQVITYRTLPIGTTASPANTLVIDFEDTGCPTLRENSECLSVNLLGATLPAGFQISATLIFSLEFPSVLELVGDSTTDYRAKGGTVQATILSAPGIESQYNFKNCATNGSMLSSFITNGAGLYYTFAQAKALFPATYIYGQKHKAVCCYGINDVRLGATSQSALIALLETWVSGMKSALPDVDLILWGPNALAADDYGGSGYVTATGLFAGMTIAQAAQAASDILYGAYAAFANDSRIQAVIQKQDVLGRTSRTVANFSGLMDDQLHPSSRGQFLSANALMPFLL